MYVEPDSKVGKVILVIGIPLFIALLSIQILNWSRAFRSLSWPAADGVITVSRTKKVHTMEGAHARPEIRYAYSVNGVAFENETIEFGLFRGILTWGYTARHLEAFPAGRGVPVYYDPQKPSVSCLRRGGIGWEDVLMFPVCLVGVNMGVRTLRTHFEGRGRESVEEGYVA